VVAYQEGRNFVGYDISQDYIELAKTRLFEAGFNYWIDK
jgi:DNA modification methylase